MFKLFKKIAIVCSIVILASCAQNVDIPSETTNPETENKVSLTVKVPNLNDLHQEPHSYEFKRSQFKVHLPKNDRVYGNSIEPGASGLISNELTPGEYTLYAFFIDGEYFYSHIETINLTSKENNITLEAKDFTKSSFNFAQFGNIKRIVNHNDYIAWDWDSKCFVTDTIIIYDHFNDDFINKISKLEPNATEFFSEYGGYIDTDSIIKIFTWRDKKDLSIIKADLEILSPNLMNKSTNNNTECFHIVMNKNQFENFMDSSLLNKNIDFINQKDTEYKRENNLDNKFKALNINSSEVIVKNHQGFSLFEDDKNSSESIYTRQYIYDNLQEKINTQLSGVTTNTRFNFKICYKPVIELQEVIDNTTKETLRYNMIIYSKSMKSFENGSGYKITNISKEQLDTFLTSPDYNLPLLGSQKKVSVTIPNKSFFSIPQDVKEDNTIIFMEIRRVKDNYVSYYKEGLSFNEVIENIPLDEEDYTVQLLGICENYCFASISNFNSGKTTNATFDKNLTKCEQIDIDKRMNSIGTVESISKPVFDKKNSNSEFLSFTNSYTFTNLNDNFISTISSLDSRGFEKDENVVWKNPKIEVTYTIRKSDCKVTAASLECYPSGDNENKNFYLSSRGINILDSLTINLDKALKEVQDIRNWLKTDVNAKFNEMGVNCTLVDYEYPIILTDYYWGRLYKIHYIYDSLNETLSKNLLECKSNCGFRFNTNQYIEDGKSFIELGLTINRETDKISEYELRMYTPGIPFGEYGEGVSMRWDNKEDFIKFISSSDYPIKQR